MRRVALAAALGAALLSCNDPGESDTLARPDGGPRDTGGDTTGDGDTTGGDTTGGDTAGDGDTTGDPDGPPPDPGPDEACTRMDIVFVVDDSPSMEDEQANLAANFPRFYELLENYQTDSGSRLDYRIAVTTTGTRADVTFELPPIPPIPFPQDGDNGEFRQECGMARPWIERGDADVEGTFNCVARVGTGGPQVEMPLYAMRLAFTEQVGNGNNAGFLRDDALLALVVLSDEDDCSVEDNRPFTVISDACKPEPPEMEPLDSYLSFFDGLKQGRGRWAAAVIAGDSSCPDAFGDAARLRNFVGKGGDNLIFRPICVDDLTGALEDAIATFDEACRTLPRPE